MKCHCGCGQEVENKYFIEGHGSKNIPKLTKEQLINAGKRLHELYPNLAKENGKKYGSIAGKKASEIHRQNKIGFFSKEFQETYGEIGRRKGGKIAVEKMKKNKIGFFNPDFHKKNIEKQKKNKTGFFREDKKIQKMGGNATKQKHPNIYRKIGLRVAEIHRKNGTGYFDKEVCSRGGKACVKKYGGYAWIDHHKNGLTTIKKIRENKPYYFAGIPHDSNEEKEVSKILYNNGMNLKEGKSVHIRIGRKEIDFQLNNLEKFGIKNGTFMEYHPWDMDKTDEQYYQSRRKVLDDNGYKDNQLLVIKNLDEFKNMLDYQNVEIIQDEV